MSNHGSEPFDGEPVPFDKKVERRKLMRDLLETTAFRGALGDFPEGQLSKTDEGSIQFALGAKDGKVIIDFGTPVHWLGMTPQQAADLASAIIKKAREVARANGESVGFTIT